MIAIGRRSTDGSEIIIRFIGITSVLAGRRVRRCGAENTFPFRWRYKISPCINNCYEKIVLFLLPFLIILIAVMVSAISWLS